jgi:hypothetical protein
MYYRKICGMLWKFDDDTPLSISQMRECKQMTKLYYDKEDKRPNKIKIFDWLGNLSVLFCGVLYGLFLLLMLSKNNSVSIIELSYVLLCIIIFPICLNLLSRMKNKIFFPNTFYEVIVQLLKVAISFLFGVIIVSFYLIKEHKKTIKSE